jgi:pimeloyl-ACP methyl ester carboxylesterase
MTVDLAYREVGVGRPVVLLHAFPLSSAMWLDQREGLSALARVVTPDLRGFGGSPLGEDDPSLDACADDLAALLDTLGLDRVVLGGLSMGGYVAMAFLRRRADRVEALLLADTKATGDPEPGRANRLRIADELDRDPSSSVLVDDVLPALLGRATTSGRPLVAGRVRGLVKAAPAGAAAWAQRAMAARPDSLEVLRGTHVPALVLVGDQDELSPVADAQAMADVLPQGQLVVLPEAGHLSAVETPDAFNDAVVGLLNRLG